MTVSGSEYNCLVVLGPTASGKTKLACALAYQLNGEIISADSRQVYRQLDIGTGKDLSEYTVNGKKISYHLIDVTDAGEQFYVHDFIRKCTAAYHEIRDRGHLPIICGGTGLYLDALRKDFSFTQIKEDPDLRAELSKLAKTELQQRLKMYPEEFTSHADINSEKRLIRAIEVAEFLSRNIHFLKQPELPFRPFYIGINISAEVRKKKIALRLEQRLNGGLIEEAERLVNSGLSFERMEFLGLEYKFLSYYLQKKITRSELEEKLLTAIVQFSKRQMTWFRKMEKEGININWVEPDANVADLALQLKPLFF